MSACYSHAVANNFYSGLSKGAGRLEQGLQWNALLVSATRAELRIARIHAKYPLLVRDWTRICPDGDVADRWVALVASFLEFGTYLRGE